MTVEQIIILGLGVAFFISNVFGWWMRQRVIELHQSNAELLKLSGEMLRNYEELQEAHRGYREATQRQEQNYLEMLELYGHDTSYLRVVEHKLPDGTTYHIIEDEEEQRDHRN